MLVLEKIYKSYGPTPVLANVNIRVTKKEMVCLSGPSGTGKSTLLRIAAGIELPDKGIVKQGSRGMGFSFQEPVLLPWKTVMKNMEFVAGYRKKDKASLHELLARLGLDRKPECCPSTLSGGMKKGFPLPWPFRLILICSF